MQIALLGNMNNNNNVLTRYLIDKGYDAKLLLYRHELKHFLPETDQFDNRHLQYTKYLSWGKYEDLFLRSSASIDKELESFDFFIGARLAPAFFAKIKRPLDLFIPTGGDLCSLPFFSGLRPKRVLQFLLAAPLQRKGIGSASSMLFGLTNPAVEKKIHSLKLPPDRIISGIPALYLPNYDIETMQKYQDISAYASRFRTLRNTYDFFVFHHIRHVWKTQSVTQLGEFHEKSNDALLRAFSRFLKEAPAASACLVLFEYGPDVEDSKALCAALGILGSVFWFPLMPRKELMYGLSMADVMVGELKNSWLSYGSIDEAMAVKVPIIHHRVDSLYDQHSELYPMLNGHDEVSVFNGLMQVYQDRDKAKKMGLDAHHWFKREAIDKPINAICSRIDSKAHLASKSS